MEIHDLITGVRWELLKLLASSPQSGSELSRQIGTTPANVSQHLKLLELAGLVRKERGSGKAMTYHLGKQLALVTVLSGAPVRAQVPIEGLTGVELQLLLEATPAAKIIRRFLLEKEELAKTFQAFGRLDVEGKDVQLFVVAPDVRALRKEYANIPYGERKLVIWSHTPAEVQEGLSRKEQYFLDMFAKLRILHDPDHLLKLWTEGSQ